MLDYNFPKHWPSADELPDSDETPVDNELQELIPGLLKAILLILWAERMDWFFGIDMGLYHHPKKPAIVPDAFLSLGVQRFSREELRPSYAVWEEKVMPIFVLEVVSPTYRQEYTDKLEEYQRLGVLYYVIYSSSRREQPHLEVHKLVNGKYELQPGNLVWMPEIGLGIGCERGNYSGVTREWLYWYDAEGKRYLTPEEQVKESAQRLQQESQRADRLAERLRQLGIDPDNITGVAVKSRTQTHAAGDRQPDFSTCAIALNRESSGKTPFLRPEICENLSKKSGKMRLYLEQTDSLTAKIEMQINKMAIGRGN